MHLIDVSAEGAEHTLLVIDRLSRGALLGRPLVALPDGFVTQLDDDTTALVGLDPGGTAWRLVYRPGGEVTLTEWREGGQPTEVRVRR
jgi:hypothetical protein